MPIPEIRVVQINSRRRYSELHAHKIHLNCPRCQFLAQRSARCWHPVASAIARWLPCPLPLATLISRQAQAILDQEELEHFFNPALHLQARNEMEIIVDGAVLRFDRVVIFEEEVWIRDYKRNLLDSERAAYAAQLRSYRSAALAVVSGKRLRTALLTGADACRRLIEMDADGANATDCLDCVDCVD